MGLGRLAAVALKWIGTALGVFRHPIGRRFATAIVGEVFGKKMQRYVGWLDWLERHAGAQTEVWRKVAEAKKSGDVLLLEPAEVTYLYIFKFKGWDRFVKKPLQKLAAKLEVDEAREGLEDGLEAGAEVAAGLDGIADEPLELDEPSAGDEEDDE
jgi:hypothetical protein